MVKDSLKKCGIIIQYLQYTFIGIHIELNWADTNKTMLTIIEYYFYIKVGFGSKEFINDVGFLPALFI